MLLVKTQALLGGPVAGLLLTRYMTASERVPHINCHLGKSTLLPALYCTKGKEGQVAGSVHSQQYSTTYPRKQPATPTSGSRLRDLQQELRFLRHPCSRGA